MYLLCIKVKRARLHGPPDKFNAYVTIHFQDLKSSTPARRGNEPLWEQEYMFEVNDIEKGLFVEVWDKGLMVDTLLGATWVLLRSVECRAQEGPGQWWPLYGNITLEGNEICGAKTPTPHKILLDVYYELPTEIPEEEAHFLIQRLKAIYIEAGELKESEEEQDYAKDTDDGGNTPGDTTSYSSIERRWDDLRSDYRIARSPTSPCAVGLSGHSPLRTESQALGPVRSVSSSSSKAWDGPLGVKGTIRVMRPRSLEPAGRARSLRSVTDTCPTCPTCRRSLLSPLSQSPLHLSESFSVDSRLCSTGTVTPSQLTPEACLSQASEAEAPPISEDEPEETSPDSIPSPAAPGSPQHDIVPAPTPGPTPPARSPTPPAQSPASPAQSPALPAQSPAPIPAPEDCSDAPAPSEDREGKDEVAPGDKLEKEKPVEKTDNVKKTALSRWTAAIEKE